MFSIIILAFFGGVVVGLLPLTPAFLSLHHSHARYLDIRKEKKQQRKQRKQEENEGSDVEYDNRRFFDEVAYEPPKLAIEKSKKFYNHNNKNRK